MQVLEALSVDAWNTFPAKGRLINTSTLKSFVPIRTISTWLQATAVYSAADSATKGKVTKACALFLLVCSNIINRSRSPDGFLSVSKYLPLNGLRWMPSFKCMRLEAKLKYIIFDPPTPS